MNTPQEAAQFARDYANDDEHGYDQNREYPDTDCSQFVAKCYGVDEDMYTGNEVDYLGGLGFNWVEFDGDYAGYPCGSVFWKSGHTAIDCDGAIAEARIDATGDWIDCPDGDQNGREILVHDYDEYQSNWEKVAIPPDIPEPAPVVDNPHQPDSDPVNDAGFNYQAHVQNLGWVGCVRDGMIAGTVGYGLRLEALKFGLPAGISIRVKIHIEGIGWKTFEVEDGNTIVGTVGEGKRIECILPEVISNTTGMTPYFCCHVQDIGWESWTPFGYSEGSTGECRRIEAVMFKLE